MQTKLLMKFFIASEAIFFISLIISYIYYRHLSDVISITDNHLDATSTGIFTVFLLASSGTIWWGRRGLHQGKPKTLALGLAITIVLGAIFLYGQGREYAHLIQDDITIDRNIFGSAFFTLTGFHALHVLTGLVILCIILGLTLAGDYQGTDSAGVASAEIYWHFVDAVWIIVFTVIYLIPLL